LVTPDSDRPTVGILHPGQMGSSLAASAQQSGCQVVWASEGRSAATRERAHRLGLLDAGTLTRLCEICDLVVSVCPPHAAREVAIQVAGHGFAGLYLDANAVSPQSAVEVARIVSGAGATAIDGGVVGPPAWHPKTTWLYLSGERAEEVVVCFAGGALETQIIGEEVGAASALKMCYAAWTKGSTALLCAILAAADELGVWPELRGQWERDWPGFAEQATGRAQRVTAKAWRFAGEMDEIAATLEASGAPGGFHAAAADLYCRLAHFKDRPTPPLDEVLAAVREEGGSQG
jgi:3-hydroxyisobutyrate dehydrogenase-like beta-hydroxyacid dehydrogenase